MIKLNLPARPIELTDELTLELTNQYIRDNSDVWNRKFIRDAVLAFSHNKCCYTECRLNSESKYMEVDHFHPKIHFPKDVVRWGNLLPSCKKSNTTKGELNTKLYPIVNPLVDSPKDHLYIKNFRFYHKSIIGRRTIDYTALNDRKHFVGKRFKIGMKVIEIIEEIRLNLEPLCIDVFSNELQIKRLLNSYKNLLAEAKREEEYSATISTIILSDDNNNILLNILAENDLLDDELEAFYHELEYCSLID
ncbi:hypothetical protein A3860_25960 [Niastella vici]|uniref:HNH nuclease domain-containing protein n=1 Tax=Niastella vici TaxID=1703345 RepID=A0A1V9FWR4_9BACT|nr:hypothetical protein [Niastella vici]OQP62764.1 hypothetical protein A3860_25960 [Niastella vici]